MVITIFSGLLLVLLLFYAYGVHATKRLTQQIDHLQRQRDCLKEAFITRGLETEYHAAQADSFARLNDSGPVQPTSEARFVLVLNDAQIYAVAAAVQLDYVTLQNGIARNHPGFNQNLVERECFTRDALGQVYDLIVKITPHVSTFAQFDTARSQALENAQGTLH